MLSNLENLNSEFIRNNFSQNVRFKKLKKVANIQFKVLIKNTKKISVKKELNKISKN